MQYFVFLIEYGKVSHAWRFSTVDEAIRHMDSLCFAYKEVNEVMPVMFKCSDNSYPEHSSLSEIAKLILKL